MVSLCCCFHNDDPGENLNSSHRGFMHTLFNKYSAVFSNGETSAVPVPSRGPPPPSMNSDGAASNITHSETTRIPPTILSFDADPGTSNAAGQSHEDTEEAEQGGDCTVLEFVLGEGKPNENDSEAPIGVSKQKAESGFCYIYASIDDEDVCPTCLEEYSLENPRIITQCNHHYHLSCIYEWMERSQTCPICDMVMIFDETS